MLGIPQLSSVTQGRDAHEYSEVGAGLKLCKRRAGIVQVLPAFPSTASFELDTSSHTVFLPSNGHC